MSNPCEGCDKKFDCYEACEHSVQWEELGPGARIKGKYKPKGISLLSYQESRLTKRSINLRELDFND